MAARGQKIYQQTVAALAAAEVVSRMPAVTRKTAVGGAAARPRGG